MASTDVTLGTSRGTCGVCTGRMDKYKVCIRTYTCIHERAYVYTSTHVFVYTCAQVRGHTEPRRRIEEVLVSVTQVRARVCVTTRKSQVRVNPVTLRRGCI